MYIFAVHSMTGMMKHMVLTLLLCFLTFSIAGCREGKDTAATLTEAEALMYTSPDSALQMLEAIPHSERLTGREQADYALLLTQARSRCRIIATSDSLIRIATDYYLYTDDNNRKATAFLYLGDVYMDMQKYTEAIVPLKQAEEVVEDAEFRIQSLVYNNLGYLNRKSGNYELALDYYVKAMNIDKASQNIEWFVSDLTNILNLPLPKVQDSASVYIKQLENMLPDARPDLQAKAYNNIGVYYEDRQQKEKAVAYYQKAIRTATSTPYRAYSNLALIYDGQGYIARADSLYQTALQTSVWSTKANIYEALSKRNLNAGNYLEAFKYMEQYQAATDSFYTHRQAQEIQELQAKYDYEIFEREKTETENLLLRFIVGSGCLLLLSTLVIHHFKNRYTRQLQTLENMIHQISHLENKEKEMEDLVYKLNESLERHQVLSDEFLRVKGKWTESEDILALGVYIRLKRDLSLYNPSSDTPILGHWLDIVSNLFSSRLQEKHQNLTTTELNVCYLHRMGYSIHEISQAMHVKPDSIKRYIYRTCTNMGIAQSREDFEKYISSF